MNVLLLKGKLYIACLLIFLFSASCKKGISPGPSVPPTDTTPAIPPPVTPVDPPTANTIGFYMNEWAAKNFTAPSFTEAAMPVATGVTININPSAIITKVSPALFGNNANPYMTQMVSEPALLNHIKNLHPGIIRFPGGN